MQIIFLRLIIYLVETLIQYLYRVTAEAEMVLLMDDL